MSVETRVRIQAPVDLVYQLTAEVEFWPTFVRNAGSVRILRRAPNGRPERLVEIGGGGGWRQDRRRLVQRLEPERGRISYREIGSGAGTAAQWTLTATSDGAATDVTLVQDPGVPFPDGVLEDLRHVAEGGSLGEGR